MRVTKQLPLIPDHQEHPTLPSRPPTEALLATAEMMIQVLQSETDEEGDDERHR